MRSLFDVRGMVDAGCIGFSEDGKSVKNDLFMKEIFKLSKGFTSLLFATVKILISGEG